MDRLLLAIRRAARAASVATAMAASACAGPGNYIWYNELSPDSPAAGNAYLIDSGDVLNIRVLGHDDMTTRVRVRGDGRVAVPMIGELAVRGKHPDDLRKEIEARLKEFLVLPNVTVNVDEMAPQTVAVLGEVARPGVFPIDSNSLLPEAIALSGGITEYASRDRIFVIRTVPQAARIRFTYEALTRDEARGVGFRLRRGDVVVVE